MYPNRLVSVFSATALGLLLSACAPWDPFAETSKTLVDEVLHPTYTQWTETNRRMAASSIAFCAGNEELADAR